MSTTKLPSVEPATEQPAEQPAAAEQPTVAVAVKPAKNKAKAAAAKPDLIQQMATMQTELLQAAELACRKLAAGEECPESDMIFAALGWTDLQIRSEVGRLTMVADLQEKAGSNADFAAAQLRHTSLSETIPAELAKLRDEVARLESEITAKQNTLQQAARNVETMTAARENLRKHIPQHVLAVYNRKRTKISGSERSAEMRDKQSRLRMIQHLLQNYEKPAGLEAEQAVIRHLEAAKPELLQIQERGGPVGHKMIIKTVLPQVWQDYCNGLRQEMPALERQVSELKVAIDAEQSELVNMLDIYLPE